MAVTNGGSGRRPGQREGRGAVPQPAEKLSIEQQELRGVSRAVAEIEWLLLILVLLYQAFGGPAAEDRPAIAAGLFFYTRPVSLLMVDSDNLQSINGDCGHEVGNRLLQLLAMCIKTELRHTDVLARHGGDKFVVMLPENPAACALDVAERIRQSVGGTPLDVEGNRVTVTVSIGLACYPEDGRSVDTVMTRADRAMLLAKERVRNKLVRFTA